MFTNDVKCKLKHNITTSVTTGFILQKYNSTYSNFPKQISSSDASNNYGSKIYLTIRDKYSDKFEIISYTSTTIANVSGTDELTLVGVLRGQMGSTPNATTWIVNDCIVIQTLTAEHINAVVPAIGYKKIPFVHKVAITLAGNATSLVTTITEILTSNYILDITAMITWGSTNNSKIKMIAMYNSITMSYSFNPTDCIDATGNLEMFMESDGKLNIKNLTSSSIIINNIFGLVEYLGV